MSTGAITETRQYLTFKLDSEVYAIDVAQVREILEVSGITRVPQTPLYMRGVINLRGSVVPVMDLRLKFGMSETEQTINTCIIVVEAFFEGETLVVGALADSVQEVFELEPSQIEPPPRMGTRLNTDFIRGMGNYDGQFIMILDIDKVFSVDDMTLVQEMETVASAA
jgi:purine-binding chemotaxis protein CheW